MEIQSVEDRLKYLIGDLMVRLSLREAEIESLKLTLSQIDIEKEKEKEKEKGKEDAQ